MVIVTANDLKTKGISDIEHILESEQEVVISVRGKSRYVMMDIAHYEFLRECEILAAWQQTREDVAAGRVRRESADAHMARVKEVFADEL
jgi:hypothetical protein